MTRTTHDDCHAEAVDDLPDALDYLTENHVSALLSGTSCRGSRRRCRSRSDPSGPAGPSAARSPAASLHRCLPLWRTAFGVRRGRWSTVVADAGAALLADLPVRIADTTRDRDRAWELSRRYDNWPVYEMVYVALAERLGHRLVTADRRLVTRLGHLDWIGGSRGRSGGS